MTNKTTIVINIETEIEIEKDDSDEQIASAFGESIITIAEKLKNKKLNLVVNTGTRDWDGTPRKVHFRWFDV